jgi:hypothetical protein
LEALLAIEVEEMPDTMRSVARGSAVVSAMERHTKKT